MTPLAAVLALALAAGPSSSPRRTAQDVSNAARAKAGLLPRKAARARTAVRAGYRVVRLPSPTFLPEPAPLADDAPEGAASADAGPEGDGPVADAAPGAEQRAAPLEVVPVVAAAPEAASPPEEPVAVRAPEPIVAQAPEAILREAPGLAAARSTGVPAGADPADDVDEPLVAARGPTVTRVLRGSVGGPQPADEIDAAAAGQGAPDPAAPPAPDDLGAVRASATGVVTEVTLSLRFDP